MSKLSLSMDLDPNSETQMRALSNFALALAACHKTPDVQSQHTAEELAATEAKVEAPKRTRASRSKPETTAETTLSIALDSEEAETAIDEAREAVNEVDPITENDDTNASEEPEVTKDMVRIRFGEKAKADQEVKVKVQAWIKGKGADKLDSLDKEHLPALLKYINSL